MQGVDLDAGSLAELESACVQEFSSKPSLKNRVLFKTHTELEPLINFVCHDVTIEPVTQHVDTTEIVSQSRIRQEKKRKNEGTPVLMDHEVGESV